MFNGVRNYSFKRHLQIFFTTHKVKKFGIIEFLKIRVKYCKNIGTQKLRCANRKLNSTG
jgi:hypothetical protein